MRQVDIDNIKNWIREVHSWLDYLESKENPHIEKLIEDTRYDLIDFDEAFEQKYDETAEAIEYLKFKEKETRCNEPEEQGDR